MDEHIKPERADLYWADLGGAKLLGFNLKGADLGGAKLYGIDSGPDVGLASLKAAQQQPNSIRPLAQEDDE